MVGMSDDLIGRYLADLNRCLRVSKERKREILAEAEDHLRESAAAGVSIGMTETEAQEAAISAYRIRRRAGGPARLSRSALPSALFPVAAVTVFGLGALGLAVVTLTGSPVGVLSGPGTYLSGALVALAVAAAYVPRAFRAFRSPS
jgi:hypothetical protein